MDNQICESVSVVGRYKDFDCWAVRAINGDTIHLMVIPKGDPLEGMFGITEVLGYIGKNDNDDFPPNSVFIRPEILGLEDGTIRVIEAVAKASLNKIKGEEGYFFIGTQGGIALEQIMEVLKTNSHQ